jgi:hypothetical protein
MRRPRGAEPPADQGDIGPCPAPRGPLQPTLASFLTAATVAHGFFFVATLRRHPAAPLRAKVRRSSAAELRRTLVRPRRPPPSSPLPYSRRCHGHAHRRAMMPLS